VTTFTLVTDTNGDHMPEPPSLTDFLLERIAEDEAVARAATQSEKWWHWPEDNPGPRTAPYQPPTAYVRAQEDPYIGRGMEWADAVHIARWDPARSLAECETKRRIIAIAQISLDFADEHDNEAVDARAVLAALATIYADHPDYRPEWRQ
jgi:hypothetical protein